MLPSWDKLQELRRQKAPDPIPVATVPLPPQPQPDPLVTALTSKEDLDRGADQISAARVLTNISRNKGMSKLAEAVAGIKERKVAHDAKGEEWMTRINNMKAREPEAFQIGDSVLDEREGDLREMEQTMRELSNLPNGLSGKS